MRTNDGELRRFDQVVVATHADQALALLEDPSEAERRVLGDFHYTTNLGTLHTDSSFLPRARRARAAWNYRFGESGEPTITYHLNRLQGLESEHDYCLTLNEEIADEHVLGRFTYEHPSAFQCDILPLIQDIPVRGFSGRPAFPFATSR